MLGMKSHSLTSSLWLSSILTRSESADAPRLYHLAKNVSLTLICQEAIDKKVETWLDAWG
jgi:hypothetical protein